MPSEQVDGVVVVESKIENKCFSISNNRFRKGLLPASLLTSIGGLEKEDYDAKC